MTDACDAPCNIVGRSHNGSEPDLVLVEWKSGRKTTWHPVIEAYMMNKRMVAEYARDNDLLDEWDHPQVRVKTVIADLQRVAAISHKSNEGENTPGQHDRTTVATGSNDAFPTRDDDDSIGPDLFASDEEDTSMGEASTTPSGQDTGLPNPDELISSAEKLQANITIMIGETNHASPFIPRHLMLLDFPNWTTAVQ